MLTIESSKRFLFTARDAVLSGCASVGLDYQQPQTSEPTQWHSIHDKGARDAVALTQWCQQFGNPVLDSLIADALTANTDLATTQAKRNCARPANP